MTRPESPARLLLGQTDVSRLIFEMAKTEDYHLQHDLACFYPCHMRSCGGCFDILVEALYNRGGWAGFNMPKDSRTPDDYSSREWTGVYTDSSIRDVTYFHEWVTEMAWDCDDNGYFLSEMELRRQWRVFRDQGCRRIGLRPLVDMEQLAGGYVSIGIEVIRCDGCCSILPGDTVHWRVENGRHVVTRWEPATGDELVARGYMNCGGFLSHFCQKVRDEVDRDYDDDEYDDDDDDLEDDYYDSDFDDGDSCNYDDDEDFSEDGLGACNCTHCRGVRIVNESMEEYHDGIGQCND